MNKIRLKRGIAGIMASIMVIACCLTAMAWEYTTMINNFLGIVETKTLGGDGAVYYESDYTSMDDLMVDVRKFCVDEMNEGAVLLKNEGVLPLTDSVKKVTLLGRASYDTIYRNSSAGQSVNPETMVSLKSGLEDAGIEVNETLYTAYQNSKTSRYTTEKAKENNIGEESIGFYTDEMKDSFAQYNDAAIIVLSRAAGEGMDAATTDSEGISQLALHQSEKDLLQLADQYFSTVIVLINSGNAMELGWLDEYNVDACLWIGTPGNYGYEGVVNILTGKANPSGKLIDTYAANSLSAAATQNFGAITYTNAKDEGLGLVSRGGKDVNSRYVVALEGIYVGYKYYETRYEDFILKQGNADSPAGVFASAGAWNYADEVVFPFGYGLSYTSFEQTLDEVTWEDQEVKATITVTNTGNVAGKAPVQLYFQSPYTDYDKENLVEKSAIQIIGIGKTDLLEPGESETVEITADEYLLASYDYKGVEGYILDAGDYYFAIGDDAHDALNNVLAAKNATGMVDAFGSPVEGNADKTALFTRDEMDSETYKVSQYTGEELENHMEDADINYWIENCATYMTRQDWNTFPKKLQIAATPEMITILKTSNSEQEVDELYVKAEDCPGIDTFTQGADNGIKFISMKDVPYEDDDTWNKFLDQLTLEELCSLTNHGAAESVGKPAVVQGDGGDGANGVQFAGATIAASTFNPELMRQRGDMIAELDMKAGIAAHWAPGGDIHRTPFGGRNFEYYSEDAVLSYIYEAIECGAMQEKGLMAMPKHFAGNDQETSRKGVCTFTTEQAWREGPLKGFEGAFTVGGAMGTMTGYHRYGLTYTAESSAVNINILRNEWGFKGATITDAASGSTLDMFTSGTDLSCMSDRTEALMHQLEENNDGYLLGWLRKAAKNVCYADLRSTAINGLSGDTKIQKTIPWWKVAIIAADVVVFIITMITVLLYVRPYMKKKKEGKKK